MRALCAGRKWALTGHQISWHTDPDVPLPELGETCLLFGPIGGILLLWPRHLETRWPCGVQAVWVSEPAGRLVGHTDALQMPQRDLRAPALSFRPGPGARTALGQHHGLSLRE